MTVTKITSFKQFEEVVNGEKPVVIDFFATWCGPCKIISPIFHTYSEQKEFSDHIDFYEVDVDQQEEIAAVAQIRAMPTFIAFYHGEAVGNAMGANPRALLQLVTGTARDAADK